MKSKQEQLNRTGIYLRLSKDDERAGESLSIENQRRILTEYVKSQGWQIVSEYADDGYSGTNFDRPEVQRLLDDVHMGRLDIVIVKDLSRFGRNYIEVGRYIDYEFPLYNIRFIALTDNVDTANKNSSGMDMMPIMNVFNEWHSANTSKKIRAVREANARSGKYLTTSAAYGYVKGGIDKKLPVVDDEAAEVVKRIFEMRASGVGCRKIATELTLDGILCPSDYKRAKFGSTNQESKKHCWNSGVVRKILQNPIYLGHLAQMRRTTVSYKNKKAVNRDESEWIIVKNTHEPIVTQEIWDKCREMDNAVGHGKIAKSGKMYPLSGLVYCPDCGGKIRLGWTTSKRSDGTVRHVSNYNCGNFLWIGKHICSSHYINQSELDGIVLNDIRSKIRLVIEDEDRERREFLKRKEQLTAAKLNSQKRKYKNGKDRLAELERLIQSVYEDKVTGKIPEEVCVGLIDKYLAEKRELTEKVNELEKSLSESEQNAADIDEFIRRLKKYAQAEELTREMCMELIECVTVSKFTRDKSVEREIHIYYKLMDKGYTEQN
ncbi:MAG: recombinase family protein [Clostridia bacterium]|nr:recombinase family protein [Clostridia bacterium]